MSTRDRLSNVAGKSGVGILVALTTAAVLLAVVVFRFFGDDDVSLAGVRQTGGAFDTVETSQEPRRVFESDPTRNANATGTSHAANDAGGRQPSAELLTELDDFGVAWARITGTVTAADGSAVEGASVTLHRDIAAQPTVAQRGPVIESVPTDGSGAFRIDRIEGGGRYVLRVVHAGFRGWRTGPIRLEPGRVEHYDIRLGGGVALRGRVVEDATGTPINGARVQIFDLDDQVVEAFDAFEREGVTGPDGRFEIADLIDGRKRIIASASGYGAQTVPYVEISAYAPPRTDVEIRLGSGGAIRGRVYDLEGRALPGVEITARAVTIPGVFGPGQQFSPVRSGVDGSYTVDGLPPGLYSVSARAEGFGDGRFQLGDDAARRGLGQPSTFDDGQARRFGTSAVNARVGEDHADLFLAPAPMVRGRVTDAVTGRPVRAFRLLAQSTKQLMNVDRSNLVSVVADDGRFAFSVPSALAARGTFFLHVLAPGFATGAADVVLAGGGSRIAPAGGVDGVIIRLERGASIVGRVVDRAGRGIARARIHAVREFEPVSSDAPSPLASLLARRAPAAPMSAAVSGEDGSFAVANLNAGSWYLRIEHDDYATEEIGESYRVGDAGELAVGDLRLYEGGKVYGLVSDASGGPEEGVKVKLHATDRVAEDTFSRTGIDGVYAFEHVRPGLYEVSVIERGGRTTIDLVSLAAPSRRRVIVEDRRDVREDL